MANIPVNERVQKYRTKLRVAGLRPIQIWVPDTRQPDFAEECRRQSMLAVGTDAKDEALHQFMEESLDDVEGWSD